MLQVCPHCGTKNRFDEQALSHEVNCGKCRKPILAAEPMELSDAVLGPYLNGTDLPVIVDFWAPWCGPCRMMAPHFSQAATEMPRVRFVKVNSDESPNAASRYAIRSIPTLIHFLRGREVKRTSGVMSADQLKRWIMSATDHA